MLSMLSCARGFGFSSSSSSRIIPGWSKTIVRATTRVEVSSDGRHSSPVDQLRSRAGLGLRYNSTVNVKSAQQGAHGSRERSIEPQGTRREALHGEIVRGKLLTTPSRLLKLILPLSGLAGTSKDVEPLALLVHPQQPLSYLERLIQAEVPSAVNKKGEYEKPEISFMVLECQEDEIRPKLKVYEEDTQAGSAQGLDQAPSEKDTLTEESETRDSPDLGPPSGYTLRHHVRWSPSTEIGDFIRDAAKASEFAVVIEYSPREQIHVAVPSFNDRTYYLRMRLRKTSGEIGELTGLKNECDKLAHRGAQRMAIGGFGILAGWWFVVYRLTFDTDLGWDTMEPVTYLVSLSTLMGGYLWFLYHNREVSYRTAFNLSINRRQAKLYQSKGLDLQRWEALVDEANSLRREIKGVAAEYDVDWNEKSDEQDEAVTEALKKEREQKTRKSRSQSKGKGGSDDDDD